MIMNYKRFFSQNWSRLALLAVTVALMGCTSTQTTRFHVAVANIDQEDPELKFYRVTIRAKASNVSAALQTGFYDANAVRELYGEVRTNAPSAGRNQIGTHQFLFDPG